MQNPQKLGGLAALVGLAEPVGLAELVERAALVVESIAPAEVVEFADALAVAVAGSASEAASAVAFDGSSVAVHSFDSAVCIVVVADAYAAAAIFAEPLEETVADSVQSEG